jgi:hypothetical protein
LPIDGGVTVLVLEAVLGFEVAPSRLESLELLTDRETALALVPALIFVLREETSFGGTGGGHGDGEMTLARPIRSLCAT